MSKTIQDFNSSQDITNKDICTVLAAEISKGLPEAEGKIWHGGPVWFLDSNPIVGYFVRKQHVTLLFWSGQSFDEPALLPEGSFKAAEFHYTSPEQINREDLALWLKKSREIQWDYKNLIKRKGKLLRLK